MPTTRAHNKRRVRKDATATKRAKTGRSKAPTEHAVQSGYAPVNGLNIYYEIHGTGEPLLLLHGGVGGIEMFGPNLRALSQHRRVIAVDFQGHGHTGDIDRPLRSEWMADDMAALMKYLGIDKADVVGNSLVAGSPCSSPFDILSSCANSSWYRRSLSGMAGTPRSRRHLRRWAHRLHRE
jgi:hypothetical protein